MTEPAPPPVTPLEVLLRLMRDRWAEGDFSGAADLAKVAAPFLHPRAPAATPARRPSQMDDEELAAWMEEDDDPADEA